MNWYQELDNFQPLEWEEISTFAPPREMQQAVEIYNKSLSQVLSNNRELALPALGKLVADHPLFPQATHLLAVCLAVEARFGEAEPLFKRLLLMDIHARVEQVAKKQLTEVQTELNNQQSKVIQSQKKEELLLPVKADLAQGSILHKASAGKDNRVRMATPREVRRILRKSSDSGDGPSLSMLSDSSRERIRLIQTISVVVVALSILFLAFFFLLRPVLQRAAEAEQYKARLYWLETRMADDIREPVVARIAQDYRIEFGSEQTEMTSSTTAEATEPQGTAPDRTTPVTDGGAAVEPVTGTAGSPAEPTPGTADPAAEPTPGAADPAAEPTAPEKPDAPTGTP